MRRRVELKNPPRIADSRTAIRVADTGVRHLTGDPRYSQFLGDEEELANIVKRAASNHTNVMRGDRRLTFQVNVNSDAHRFRARGGRNPQQASVVLWANQAIAADPHSRVDENLDFDYLVVAIHAK